MHIAIVTCASLVHEVHPYAHSTTTPERVHEEQTLGLRISFYAIAMLSHMIVIHTPDMRYQLLQQVQK